MDEEIHEPAGKEPSEKDRAILERNRDMRAILVTTKHRGVFAGLVPDDQDMTATTMGLKDARMAIRWATKGGVAELAEIGPNSNSLIGSKADIEALHDITAVWAITETAWQAWTAS